MSFHRPSALSNDVAKTAGPIKTKFLRSVQGTCVCGGGGGERETNHDPKFKMAFMPIDGKTIQKNSSPEPLNRFRNKDMGHLPI